ncbi:MAG: hypothetical protein AAGK01_07325 [Pseudomonadota bacterium]
MPPIAKIIWSAGFLIGTITHSLDIFHGGWLPYDFRPLPFNIYWTSLTFLDPMAAILVWVRERWAVVLGVAIMVSNVLVNGYTAFIAGYEEFYFGFAFQSAFAAFVLFAAWEHWRTASNSKETGQ